MAKYTASEIAKWLLHRQLSDKRYEYEDDDRITNMKLQKLLYYTQGVYMGCYGSPLFDDDIEAWDNGPVVRTVYHEYKEYVNKPIDIPEGTTLDMNTFIVTATVFNYFNGYTASMLRKMTHNESPWIKTREINKNIIDKEVIKDFFSKNYNKVKWSVFMNRNYYKLKEFEMYEENWDGEGALPIDKDVICAISELIKTLDNQPELFPIPTGGIEMAFGSPQDRNYLSFDINSRDNVEVAWFFNNDINNIQNDNITFKEINNYVSQFYDAI